MIEKIKLVCGKCGGSIDVIHIDLLLNGDNPNPTIDLEPCENCMNNEYQYGYDAAVEEEEGAWEGRLDEAHREGHNEGKEEGLKDGYDEGYADGVDAAGEL